LPALNKARQAAALVQCSSNLKQLSTCMLMYEQDYKGGLIMHWTDGPLWPYLLKPYFGRIPNVAPGQVETRDKILLCPMAYEKPTPDSDKSPTQSPFQAFYTENAAGSSTNWGGFKVQAAYGMNRYLYDARVKSPTNAGFFTTVYPNATFFSLQKLSARQPAPIPMLMDCRWREVYVDKNTSGYYGYDTVSSKDTQMPLIATQRHGKYTNVALMDLSVRSVPLPELWTFKWRDNWTPPAKLPPVPW
jgi:hypothetical protein